MSTVHVVVPAGVDDPARPSGGNAYDGRVCRGLSASGWAVHRHEVVGPWPRADPSARARLARVLADIPDDSTVLLDGLVACPSPEALVPERDRLRLVVLVHLPLGCHQPEADVPERERSVLDAATAVVCTSRWTRSWLVATYGLDPSLIHVAFPGVEKAPLATADDSGSRLLCVGAVTPTKGHDVLVAALARVRDLPWSCSCVGALDLDPSFAGRLRDQVAAAGLEDRLVFSGPQVGGPLHAMYAASDLVLVPSRIETYGMVVTEALARGLPVVGSDVGGLPEALGGPPAEARPGVLVPPGDPDALAAALRRWLTDAALRGELRAAARVRRANLRDWSATTAGFSRALKAVAA